MREPVKIMGQLIDRPAILHKEYAMSQAPKDTRSAAQKACDTAGIIGSFMHEGYGPNPEDEAIHQRAERGEITTEEAIAIFRESALERERKALGAQAYAIRLEEYDNRSESSRLGRWGPASQLKVALLPTMGRIVTELKTPLDERALDRLTLASDAATVAYQEQRLKLQAARKVRDNRQRADLAQTQTGANVADRHDDIPTGSQTER